MTTFDIELALTTLSEDDLKAILIDLPKEFEMSKELRSGWGYTIRRNDTASSIILNDAINIFLKDLSVLEKIIRRSSSKLRVGIYNDKATCTLNLSGFSLLDSLKVELIATIYPVE